MRKFESSTFNLGTGKNNTIKEIWNSEQYKKLKETHLNKNRDKITPCDRCGIS